MITKRRQLTAYPDRKHDLSRLPRANHITVPGHTVTNRTKTITITIIFHFSGKPGRILKWVSFLLLFCSSNRLKCKTDSDISSGRIMGEPNLSESTESADSSTDSASDGDFVLPSEGVPVAAKPRPPRSGTGYRGPVNRDKARGIGKGLTKAEILKLNSPRRIAKAPKKQPKMETRIRGTPFPELLLQLKKPAPPSKVRARKYH